MAALDAITTRAEFLDAVHDPVWHEFLTNYVDSSLGRQRGLFRSRSGEFYGGTIATDFYPSDYTGEQLSKRLMHIAQMAHTYYVSPTMEVLVTAASHDWPNDEPVREDDFPQPQGWLWIPGGITILDVRGNLMVTNAIMWDCYGGGVDIFLITDKNNKFDQLKALDPERWEWVNRFAPWHQVRLTWGQKLPHVIQLGKAVPPELAEKIQVNLNPKTGQYSWFLPEGWGPEELLPHEAIASDLAWLISCLRIMQQPLARVSTQGLPAGLRKKLRRIKMTSKLVTVIEYRRTDSDRAYQVDTGRTLSHRYFRRGHWRRQPFKNERGDWDRKVIRIQPQIVGDPSLPLKMREHVSALVR